MDALPSWIQDFVRFRKTRSGATFSNLYTITDTSFDLDQLLKNAAADEEDDPDPTGADADEDWVDEEIAPSTADSSPLSSPPASEPGSRAPSPPPLSHHIPTPDLPNAATRDIRPTIVGKKRAKKERARERRAKKAARAKEEWGPPAAKGRRRRGAKRILEAQQQDVDISWDDMPVNATGYGGKRGENERKLYSVEDLVGPEAKVPGMTLYDWDGREPTGIAAPDGRVFAVLAGQPDDASWTGAHQNLADEIRKCESHVNFPAQASDHRRGRFGAQAYGVSHGGGQTEPANLKHGKAMHRVLVHLIGLTSMMRIALFASSVFACWAPLLFAYYAEHMAILFANDPTLVRNFARSVWACITINFGPRTVTFKHRDFGNLPFGWCAVTALGRFDPQRGGHIVLWECKLVIRFPPGSTVLIPSAIIHHSNTRLQRGEQRFSVTQYTAGALFRWVDHHCKLDAAYYGSLSAKEKARAHAANARRWKEGVELWSKISDLRKSAAEVLE
ncbi:hypothetical protein BD626DRAFT_575763 [Schizophyllum amplum]|uniref:Uncharacterized protein n=1 Tax=Schizophyllum amplum TaxID=97359 RepID=A0A550BUY3_9AGAR|nr:hypothetical protein BD626DRAFT_575763 [Auriculariopsis ampla]